MRIKSMTATFGRLDHARLEPEAGLNLIHAPNEGGKSTWCAFWKTMLFGLDTRDRDKKGYLADKNRYQPWSGAPMEGEMTLEWQGRDVTIRRGPKGNTPFGSFSAVYTGTGDAVPGLTGDNCGALLTGVGREVFERSAFIGSGGNLSVTAAPELEKRIAALVSSGEEDVSFSQTQARLREWLNRRKVNRSVGLIPKLEGELDQIRETQARLEDSSLQIAQLEGERTALEREKAALTSEAEVHRRLAQRELDRRFAQAEEEWKSAQAQLTALEGESAKYGALPDREQLKKAQGELQYLKVLDEEIRQGEAALKEAEEAYIQAQIAAQDERFAGMTGDEAVRRAEDDRRDYGILLSQANKKHRRFCLFQAVGLLTGGGILALDFAHILPNARLWGVLVYFLWAILSGIALLHSRRAKREAAGILSRWQADSADAPVSLARDYAARCQAADEAARNAKAVRGALNDRKARRDNSRADLLNFVHTFAPQATDLFGCSAALSRALNLDHETALARERVEERRRRREDLAAQGGRNYDTLEFLHTPERPPEETDRALAAASGELDRTLEALNQARGRQKALGDPAALAARREELEEELTRRKTEYEALTVAMDALAAANARLQERFSPALNQLAGQYLSRLTGGTYRSVTLNRAMEGEAARSNDLLPHSALYLSRGAADQLYLAVRLAVCSLCLPDKPPILLDDALAAFDDQRLLSALDLLRELSSEQQILLFTCHQREGTALSQFPGVKQIEL